MSGLPKQQQKRYNLVIAEDLFNEMKEAADQRGITVVEMLRKFIKLGLIALKTEDNPNASLMIRENGTEREILIL